MSAQHTQGLMKVHTENADGWPLLMIGGRIVANVNAESGVDTTKAPSIAFKPMPAEANARRLVACWNALEKVDTDVLESLTLPGDVSWALAINTLAKERDEMLTELRSALELIESQGITEGDTVRGIRSAIAKVTGSPT